MGGRGSSSGIGSRSGGGKPKYFGETEKAVSLKISVTDYDLETTRTRTVWVPKSQLASDGRPSEWITEQKAQELYSSRRSSSQYEAKWSDADGKTFSASKSAREIESASRRAKAFEAGKQSYNALIAEAKALGIKGIRVGMKRSTIEEKIRKKKNR